MASLHIGLLLEVKPSLYIRIFTLQRSYGQPDSSSCKLKIYTSSISWLKTNIIWTITYVANMLLFLLYQNILFCISLLYFITPVLQNKYVIKLSVYCFYWCKQIVIVSCKHYAFFILLFFVCITISRILSSLALPMTHI